MSQFRSVSWVDGGLLRLSSEKQPLIDNRTSDAEVHFDAGTDNRANVRQRAGCTHVHFKVFLTPLEDTVSGATSTDIFDPPGCKRL